MTKDNHGTCDRVRHPLTCERAFGWGIGPMEVSSCVASGRRSLFERKMQRCSHMGNSSLWPPRVVGQSMSSGSCGSRSKIGPWSSCLGGWPGRMRDWGGTEMIAIEVTLTFPYRLMRLQHGVIFLPARRSK